MIDPNEKQDEHKDWQLDAMLDSLLQSYSAAEPRPGLETRLRAVVNAQAVRARRTHWLMLAASAAAVALFAWMMIANPHKTKTSVAGPTVAPTQHAKTRAGDPEQDSAAAATNPDSTIVIQSTASHRNRQSLERPAKINNDKTNRIVLQMVAATQGSESLVFERQKLYLTPEKPPETETETAAVPDQETQAPAVPAVTIKSIGVASIETNAPVEIKDLAPPKSSTEKGSL